MQRIINRIRVILRKKGLIAVIRTIAAYAMRLLSMPIAWAWLMVIRDRDVSIEEALRRVSARRFWGLMASTQIPSEITSLLALIQERKPRTILEIGTASGGTLYLFTRVAAPDATIVSLDLRAGGFGGGYPAWKIPLYHAFARSTQRMELMRADSHESATLEKVRRILGDRPLDFLFIDGDHSYEGVKRDFEMYSPIVARGGIVAFHDIVPGSEKNVGGAPRFWEEIKARYPHKEFVESWSQGGLGIGVLFPKEE